MIKMINWKTSLIGILGGVMLAGPQIQACLMGTPCDWKQFVLGVLATLGGLAAKDYNVTGGTREQPDSPRIAASRR